MSSAFFKLVKRSFFFSIYGFHIRFTTAETKDARTLSYFLILFRCQLDDYFTFKFLTFSFLLAEEFSDFAIYNVVI